jgi:hypothetical protein
MTAHSAAGSAAAGAEAATLDPADWDSFAALAHRMVDDMLGHLRTVRERPAWQPMPAGVRASFSGPVPWEGEGAERAYEDFVRTVLPYPNGNLHPRFWGWVHGGGTPLGMMADMLASGLNAHLAGFNQAPALVEHEVIRWLAELIGMPADASGVLVSGATMANVLALAVALDRHIALPALDHQFHDKVRVLSVERRDVQVRVQDLNLGVGLQVTRGDVALPLHIQPQQLRLVAVQFERQLFQVQDELRHILNHTGDRGKLMEHVLDLHRRDRGPGNR